MSAFCGIVALDGSPPARDEAASMVGVFAVPPRARPVVWTGGSAALGWAPIPLTPEDRFDRQPRHGRDGAVAFLFAGRLDNRDELAAALGLDPATTTTLADGALALQAFERWGDGALSRLLGAWTLAAWDEPARRLLLARDPMGGRALFYHRQGATVTFASSFSALLRLPRIERTLDETVLGDLLLLTFGERDRTVYRDLRRVPGGHAVICTPDRLEVTPFWQPPDGPPLRLPRDDDYVDAMRELLDRAVAASLRSIGPVAVQGSGGLDSAGIAATAARLTAPAVLRHYCRVPPPGWQGPVGRWHYPDERPKLRALAAAHPNLRVIEVDDAGLHPLDSDPRGLFARYGLPSIAADNLGWHSAVIDRIRTDGHRVILTGDFGNNGFSAAGRAAPWELLCGLRLPALARELAGWRRRYGWSWPLTIRATLLNRLLPARLQQWRADRRAPGGRGWLEWSLLRPEFAQAAGIEDRARELGTVAFGPRGRSPHRNRAVFHSFAGRLQGDFLSQSVAVDGVEFRMPLIDLRLVEFTLRLPSTQLCRDGVMRWLARRTLADRLPPEITDEIRMGAQDPEWYDRVSLTREQAAAELPGLAQSPLAARLLDMERAARLLEDWPADAEAAHARLGECRLALGRGLHIARFIRWAEGGNQ